MKNGGQTPWNAFPICETFKISFLMGRLHSKDVLENFLKDQPFRLVHWWSIITLFLRKSSQESINSERKSYLDCSSDTYCTRWEEGWRTGCRPWGVGNDGRIWNLLEKTQCKGSNNSSRKKGVFIFSNRRWTNQTSWRRSRPENIHLDTGSSNSRRRSKRFSWRMRRVSSTTSRLVSGCRWSDKWLVVHVRKLHIPPSHWTQSQTLLAERRNIPYFTSLIYIDVTRTTCTNLDVKQEKRIDDYWNIDGSRDWSDPWTGFTQITLLEENPPDEYMWSGGRLTKRQATSRPDHLWPELWRGMARNA